MGRIREYNNTQTINPSPLDQAAYRVEKTGMIQGAAMRETGAAGARVINRFEDSIAQGETSDLAKKMSDLDLQTTQAYEDEKQKGDMTDPDFASKFVEKHLQPNLDKLGEDLLTPEAQKMYQQASLKLTSEYTKRAISDQATFAGNKAITDYKSQITTYSNLSTNDPTTTDHNAEMLRIAIEAASPQSTAKLDRRRRSLRTTRAAARATCRPQSRTRTPRCRRSTLHGSTSRTRRTASWTTWTPTPTPR
jgi:hypothetical protein